MTRTILYVALASLLVLAGCGSGEEEQAKSSISDYLMKQQADNQMISLKQKEADCISSGMVDGIGVDNLKKYGFLKEDGTVNEKPRTRQMSKKDSTTMVDAMFRCTDVMKTMRQQLATSMGNQPPEVKACFDKALTKDAVHDMLVASLAGDRQTASRKLMAPIMKCATLASGAPSATPSG